MLAECIILLLIIVFLSIVSIPYLLTLALKRVFSQVQMKLYSPFSMRGILLNGTIPVWGLSHLTIYISAIQLGFSPNKFKLRLNFDNFQIFFTRKQNSLCPINLIDGFQEANILYNLLYILKNHGQFASSQQQFEKEPQKQKQKHIMKFFLQGALHLVILIVIYLVQVDFNHCKLFVVSGFPENLVRFQSKQQRKQTIMLMQCLAQYSIKCNLITVKTTVKHHLKYKLIFKCSDIKADSFNHWKYHFIEVREGQLEIAVPFSMSISESLKELDFTIRIGEGTVNLIPSDFDHFFQFVKKMKFNPFEVRSAKIQQSSEHQVELFIDRIKVNLRDIYEAGVDNLQAKQYLLNIDSVSVTLQNVRLQSNTFSVDKSSLSINKFLKDQIVSHSVEVLRLQRLCIQSIKSEFKTFITHDEVTITCLSEEIVLFGKIFTIINSRILFQRYNQDIYRQLLRNYIPGGTLISQMEEMINTTKLNQSSPQEIAINRQETLIYMPKKMVVFLQMKKLRHVITFDGFKYIRHHNYNEMSHQILVNKATVEYRYLKEFVVTDFTLIFSQTIAENQLSIQIKDIAMVQNEQTLTDYLDSFTLFKHLLQFESDQQEEQKKLAKKQISIEQISITLQTEVITLKQLQIDKNSHVNQILNNLYFSLGKCDIMLTKMKNPKRLLNYSINPNHCLFSIDSLTVRTNYQLRHTKAKQKIMVFLKDPTFVLPEIDISTRILDYMHMYEGMKNHIEAYLINVTNEKLISLKFHIKQFLVEPVQILFKIANMNLSIADNKLNSAVLGFSKTVREYLSLEHKYNESEAINIIRRNNKTKYPLLSIKIELITLQISRINELSPNEQSINQWICDFQKIEALPQEQTERLRSVKAGMFKIKSNSLIINVRDYPSPIMSIGNIVLETSILKTKRIFGECKNYLTGKLQIVDAGISMGLGQLSGLQQIDKRINELNVIKDSQINAALVESGEKTIWHKIFQDWKWAIEFRKPTVTLVQILTGDNPYSSQKFEMTVKQIRGQSETESTSLQFSSLQLKLKQFLILKTPTVQIISKISLVREEFEIDTKIYTGEESCILRISSWLVVYLQELGQLQKDWLLIYGIYERQTEKKVVEMEDIESMSYIEIANLLANQKINSKDPNSLFNFLSRVYIHFRISSVKIALIEQDLQMAINLLNIGTFTVLRPNHQLYNKWEVVRSKIGVEEVKATFGKIFTEEQLASRQSLNIKPNIDKSILNDDNTYQFVNCKEVVVNFNWYFVNEKTVGLANTWIGVASINGQISKRLERYCSRIIKLFFKNQKRKEKSEQHSAFIKPIKKFRQAVLHVVRINRRNKIRSGHIKKHNLVVQIKQYEFKLVSDSSSMKLTSNCNAHFFHTFDFGENDHYHSKPNLNLILLLPSSTIALSEDSSSSQQTRKIMNIGKLKLEICKVDQSTGIDNQIDWGTCQFEDISVQLNGKSKELLQNIIFLIVDLVNSHEVRKQRYRVQTEKYSQLVNNKRDRLKDKIQWKQSDLKWSEQKIFQWKFQFRRLSVLISNGDTKIASAAIGQTEVDLHIFSNSKIERKVVVTKVEITNQIEPATSPYRKVLQLGKQSAGFTLIADSYEVKAFSDVAWDYFRDIQLCIEPIRLRVTDELISSFIEYIGEAKPTQNQDEYDELAEYRNKTPDYYKHFCIKQMNLQLWMRSSSFMKRMEGIKLKLDQYEVKEKLYTQGELFRAWAIWLAKQITRQSLDVLGQKIFGED